MTKIFKSTLSSIKNKDININDDLKYNGVYMINCRVNNKKYIGSTSNLDKRIKTHKQHLQKGCHNNRKLQKDYDKYGIDNFEFIILEKDIDDVLLTAYEKYWMYKHDSIVRYKGYNEIFPTLNHQSFKYVYNIKEEKQNGYRNEYSSIAHNMCNKF